MIAVGDLILPGLLGIMITHSRETYQPTSIMRWDRGIFNGSLAIESQAIVKYFVDLASYRMVMFHSFLYLYQRVIIPEINHLGGCRYIIPNGAHCSPEPWNHGWYMIYIYIWGIIPKWPDISGTSELWNNLPRNMVCWKIHHFVRWCSQQETSQLKNPWVKRISQLAMYDSHRNSVPTQHPSSESRPRLDHFFWIPRQHGHSLVVDISGWVIFFKPQKGATDSSTMFS